MYCKNCGRQLKEGTRFCDRCGQSVRKNTQTKRQEIEELKTERLNRKKRLAEKEARQTQNKKKRRSGSNTFVFIIVILLIAVLSVIIGYNMFSKNEPININAGSTAAPGGTSAAATPQTSASSLKSGYATITVGSVTCPYPSVFHTNTASGNEKLNLVDSLGGATMIVSQEGKTGVPKDLMLQYAEENGNVTYSRAGDDWYAITVESGDTINHRKCIIRNGLAVYYDFSYKSSTSSGSKYEEYIDYIDANFK